MKFYWSDTGRTLAAKYPAHLHDLSWHETFVTLMDAAIAYTARRMDITAIIEINGHMSDAHTVAAGK